MLNRAARFFPILQELKRQLPAEGELLEVGSGSLGLGEFWNRTFVGCDVSFTTRPVNHMRAVACSGVQLPFGDRTFDAVVVSEVMEHVLHPFPDDSLFADVPAGWARRVIPNESLSFHYWMMRTEMFRSWNYAFRLALRMSPRLVEKVLHFVNREPSYRKLFVLTRIGRLDYA